MLVGAIVVYDEMQVHLGGGFGIDPFEEPDEFLVPVTWHAVADYRTIEHAHGRKQSGRAVAFVVVRHRPTAPFLQRQTGLGAVEGLDLAFLVHAQNKGFVRGIQIQSNDIVQLLDKLCVAAEFEGFDEMGFEIVVLPDTADGGLADALCLGHRSCTPMCRSGRRRMQGRFDHRFDFPRRDFRNATGSGSVFFQSGATERQETLPPQLNGGARHSQMLGDIVAEHALGGLLNNLGTLH